MQSHSKTLKEKEVNEGEWLFEADKLICPFVNTILIAKITEKTPEPHPHSISASIKGSKENLFIFLHYDFEHTLLRKQRRWINQEAEKCFKKSILKNTSIVIEVQFPQPIHTLSQASIEVFRNNLLQLSPTDPRLKAIHVDEEKQVLSLRSIFLDSILFTPALTACFPDVSCSSNQRHKISAIDNYLRDIEKQHEQTQARISSILKNFTIKVTSFFPESGAEFFLKTLAGTECLYRWGINHPVIFQALEDKPISSQEKLKFLESLQTLTDNSIENFKQVQQSNQQIISKFNHTQLLLNSFKKAFTGIDDRARTGLMGETSEFLRMNIEYNLDQLKILEDRLKIITNRPEHATTELFSDFSQKLKEEMEIYKPKPLPSSPQPSPPKPDAFFKTPTRSSCFLEIEMLKAVHLIHALPFSDKPNDYFSFDIKREPEALFEAFKKNWNQKNKMELLGKNALILTCNEHPNHYLLLVGHAIQGTSDIVFLPHEIINQAKYDLWKENKQFLEQLVTTVKKGVTAKIGITAEKLTS